MKPKNGLSIGLILMIIEQSSGVLYNQPKFCPNASWNPNATTFAKSTTIGNQPYDIFINTNNTIYVTSQSSNGQITVWLNGNTTPISNISINTAYPYSIFATTLYNMYVNIDNSIGGVSKWTINSTTGIPAMYICGSCYDLFVDINNTLYCSMGSSHQIVTKSLNIQSNTLKVVAGTGSPGPNSNMLWNPRGIFVDINFDLYVCDSGNNRIQLFQSGESNATTLIGDNPAIYGVILDSPTAIILDADKNIYISDYGNHRIVGGSAVTGFRCLVGCINPFGSSASQLEFPWAINFDSYGNLFVTDSSNNRVQKFMLSTSLCETIDDNTTLNETITSTLIYAEDLFSTTIEEPNNATIDPLNMVSYNQPKFDAFTSWSANAITFANSTIVSSMPYGIFINSDNTIYVANQQRGQIRIWLNNSITPTQTLSGNLSNPYSLFVTITGDIYIDNSDSTYHVDKRTLTTNTSIVVMDVDQKCYGLFVAINNVLYCSMSSLHQVIIKSLNDNSNVLTMVAGTGCPGSTSNMLYNPHGIFVDTNLDLYVADYSNNRIQLFQTGQLSGITAAGNGSPNITITLHYPTGIILDGDKNLFIADSGNYRIVRSGPTGFQCIVGCTGTRGSASNQLYNPWSLSFDSYGNIFVTDSNNNRVQKFMLLNYSLDLSYNQPKFCPSTTWNPTPIILNTSSSQSFYGIFVNTNDIVYGIDQLNNEVVIWPNNDIYPSGIFTGSLSSPYSIFVTNNGEIYVDNGASNGRVDKWSLNTNVTVPVMYVSSSCYGLFVDISNTLYCSLYGIHQVVKRSLDDNTMTSTGVAGINNTLGSTSNLLYSPCGIFVDTNYDLYVADSGNNRIQLFQSGNLTAITVAGTGSLTTTITLNDPTGIILDADKYLFIADSGNQRIVGSGPTGFRCILGCSNINSVLNPFSQPWSLSFDSYGNIFVTDVLNYQIQKFSLASNSCVLSYNKPKFCSNVTWNPNATTWASSSTIGSSPYGIFVDGLNTIYVTGQTKNSISIWPDEINSVQKITGTFNNSKSIFVSILNDIYIDNGYLKHRVDKWSYNSTYSGSVMNVSQSCYGLFIDLNNTLYCSLAYYNQVIKSSLSSAIGMIAIAAGNGSNGSESHMLSSPRGIYVNLNFNLYVADCGNNRIQLFSTGQLNGTTLTQNISLNCPTGIVLDADDYLFIVDSNNHRIIGVGPNGFQCLVGCSGTSGSSPNKLNSPQSMAFDSYGNIFVSDRNNSRIQVFNLATNLCEEFTTVQSALISTMTTAMTTITQTILTTSTIQSTTLARPTTSTIQSATFTMPTTSTIRSTTLAMPTTSSYQQVNNSTNKATSIEETTLMEEAMISTKDTTIKEMMPIEETTGSFQETTSLEETATLTQEMIPVQETTPIEETATLTHEMIPVQETTVPIQGTTPIEETATLTQEMISVQETTVPIQETTPIEETATLTQEMIPVQETTVPIQETTLIEETATLTQEMTAVQETTVPIQETTPIEERTTLTQEMISVQETTVPIQETTTPIEETATLTQKMIPVQETTIPIQETVSIEETTPGQKTTTVQEAIISTHEVTLIHQTTPSAYETASSQGTVLIEKATTLAQQTTSITEIKLTSETTSVEATTSFQRTIVSTYETTSMQKTTSRQEITSAETTSVDKITSVETTTSPKETTTIRTSKSTEVTSAEETSTAGSTGHSLPAAGAAPSQFVAPSCSGQNVIGTNCNTSSLPCVILNPCKNNGTCTNSNTTTNSYICTCPPNFNGTQCQLDNRPCKPTTCWNNGVCNQTSNTTFVCSCPAGWTGIYCETMVNYCDGVNCENNGVCQPLFLNYTCQCLGTSYSGRHCEIVSTSRVVRQKASRSFGYIVIIFLLAVAAFFVIMDILKYCFGIDPAKHELAKIRRGNALQRIKHKRQLVAQRFVYIPASTEQAPKENPNNTNTDV